jgi:hypothetical protein
MSVFNQWAQQKEIEQLIAQPGRCKIIRQNFPPRNADFLKSKVRGECKETAWQFPTQINRTCNLQLICLKGISLPQCFP